MKRKQPIPTDEVAHESGSKSSHFAPPIHCIRLSLMVRMANRFRLGEKYGRGNWLRAFAEGKIDINFLRDRYDHAQWHLKMLGEAGTTVDDHIGAVGWFLNFADQAESMGLNWGDICAVVTPEEEDALRRRILRGYKSRRRIK